MRLRTRPPLLNYLLTYLLLHRRTSCQRLCLHCTRAPVFLTFFFFLPSKKKRK